MSSSERVTKYSAQILLDWLSDRFETRFEFSRAEGDAVVATVGEHRVGVYMAPLWDQEASEGWAERLRSIEERLAAGDLEGRFLLWVPPRADVPSAEPDASEFVDRVQSAAAKLPPDGRTEVTFSVTVKLGKMRDEGGYASVIGGLSRWWTRITEKVNGTYHIDSSAVHRLTMDGEARERLWDTIGQLSLSIQTGQAADFQVEEAWTLQRLPDSKGEHGFALIGSPPNVDPTEGILVRRMARRRMKAANEALVSLDVELRAVGLLGAYEYAELETAGATVKAVDPSLYSQLEIVTIVTDGDVRPTFLPRALPWAK